MKVKIKNNVGAPKKPLDELRIRVSMTLSPDSVKWLKDQNESRGRVIDRLIRETLLISGSK